MSHEAIALLANHVSLELIAQRVNHASHAQKAKSSVNPEPSVHRVSHAHQGLRVSRVLIAQTYASHARAMRQQKLKHHKP